MSTTKKTGSTGTQQQTRAATAGGGSVAHRATSGSQSRSQGREAFQVDIRSLPPGLNFSYDRNTGMGLVLGVIPINDVRDLADYYLSRGGTATGAARSGTAGASSANSQAHRTWTAAQRKRMSQIQRSKHQAQGTAHAAGA